MPIATVAGLSIGASLIGGYEQNKAAQDAAGQSAQASANALAEQGRQFNIGQSNLAPYRQAGYGALNYLTGALLPAGAYSSQQVQQTPQAASPMQPMSGGGGLLSGLANQVYQSTQSKQATQPAQPAQQKFNPYGTYQGIPTFQPGDYQQSPGYQWQYQQGLNALNNQAAAGGMRLSGRALKAAEQYGQGLANQDYGQWYQRQLQAHQQNQQDYQNYLSRIYQLAGLGSGAVNTGVTAGQNYANAAGNIQMQNAQTQGQLGMYGAAGLNNALQAGLGNYLAYGAYQNALG